MTLPRFSHPDLAAFARQLADRAQGAEPRRIYRALADLWSAVADGEPLPHPMRAMRWEIWRPLAADMQTAPAAIREGLEALYFYHMPPIGSQHGKPLIVLVHEINLAQRALRVAQAPSNPGGHHVARSAQRAPIQQAAAAPETAAATQPALI